MIARDKLFLSHCGLSDLHPPPHSMVSSNWTSFYHTPRVQSLNPGKAEEKPENRKPGRLESKLRSNVCSSVAGHGLCQPGLARWFGELPFKLGLEHFAGKLNHAGRRSWLRNVRC